MLFQFEINVVYQTNGVFISKNEIFMVVKRLIEKHHQGPDECSTEVYSKMSDKCLIVRMGTRKEINIFRISIFLSSKQLVGPI